MRNSPNIRISQVCLTVLVCWTTCIPVQADTWQESLDRVAAGVVSIRVDHTRAFDENWNQSTQATGFVVDKNRGIILTNRHVVGPGPATAQAVFRNQEEVDLMPIYRDPVHDFGFFAYNPKALRFFQPEQLKLAPEAATVGTEIRIVGNDAGEQLAILDGTLARLDRQAPEYGRGKYNDFNTFYYQAASGSSGGSSGSPVVSINGEVVALNAGSRSTAATSFFLPLFQVVRALKLLQDGQPIPRGSLHTTFVAKPFAALRKLGLTQATEANFRRQFPERLQMLVVDHILPGSSLGLRVGDVLLSVDGQPVEGFETLARILDARLGEKLNACLERAGQKLCETLQVYDLADVTPAQYIEFDGATLHNLSYQRARHFNRRIEGIYVADPGFSLAQAGVVKDSLLLEINGRKLRNLDDLQPILENTAPDTQVNVRYITLGATQTPKSATLRLDQAWFPANRCQPALQPGRWVCKSLALPSTKEPSTKKPSTKNQAKTAIKPSARKTVSDKMTDALVKVTFSMPFPLSGSAAGQRQETGVIVNHNRGLVLASRTTFPASLGDVRLTFGRRLEIPGTVVALHPAHNLALIGYDPNLLNNTPVHAARLADKSPDIGDVLHIVGIDNNGQLRKQSATLAEIEPVQFPNSNPPTFQNRNTELLQFVNGPSDFTGIVADANNEIVGLWQAFTHRSNNRNRTWHRGLPINLAIDFLQRHAAGKPWHSLGVGWYPTTLAEVRKLGTPAELLNAPSRLFEIRRLHHGTDAADKLRVGDVLLTLNGTSAASLNQIDLAAQGQPVNLSIFRDGVVKNLDIVTAALPLEDLDQVVFWSGALIQQPPRVLAVERNLPLDGVYVSFYKFGSPASRAGLVANLRILEVDEQAIHNLAGFVDLVGQHNHGDIVRLRVRDLNNREQLLTIKVDNLYWPGYRLHKQAGRWQRRNLEDL